MKPLRIRLRHSTENLVENERIELSISGCKPDVFPLALIPHCSASLGGNYSTSRYDAIIPITRTFHPLPDRDRSRIASGLLV